MSNEHSGEDNEQQGDNSLAGFIVVLFASLVLFFAILPVALIWAALQALVESTRIVVDDFQATFSVLPWERERRGAWYNDLSGKMYSFLSWVVPSIALWAVTIAAFFLHFTIEHQRDLWDMLVVRMLTIRRGFHEQHDDVEMGSTGTDDGPRTESNAGTRYPPQLSPYIHGNEEEERHQPQATPSPLGHAAATGLDLAHQAPHCLIVRELQSVDAITMSREETAKVFPKHPRDCPDTIAVLGESTLLCFSEPILVPAPSSNAGGLSQESEKAENVVVNHILHNLADASDVEMGTAMNGGDNDNNSNSNNHHDNPEHIENLKPQAQTRSDECTATATAHQDEVKLSDTSCCICLEEFQKGDFVAWSRYNLNCSHTFHHHCLLHWLEQRDHCPVCRGKYNV